MKAQLSLRLKVVIIGQNQIYESNRKISGATVQIINEIIRYFSGLVVHVCVGIPNLLREHSAEGKKAVLVGVSWLDF